ncbi:MAG: hypothetical protein QME81_11135 [bacterium]|nr:hypothetical protein [bacterium]
MLNLTMALIIVSAVVTLQGLVHLFGHYSAEETWFLESYNGRNDEQGRNHSLVQ